MLSKGCGQLDTRSEGPIGDGTKERRKTDANRAKGLLLLPEEIADCAFSGGLVREGACERSTALSFFFFSISFFLYFFFSFFFSLSAV